MDNIKIIKKCVYCSNEYGKNKILLEHGNVSTFIVGNHLVIRKSLKTDINQAFTESSFKINHCPICGNELKS